MRFRLTTRGMAKLSGVLLFGAFGSAGVAGTLDFEVSAAGRVREIHQQGFSIRGREDDFYHLASTGDFFPVNGSLYISQPGFTGPVDIKAKGLAFSVSRIDVAEYSTSFARPQTFEVEGLQTDGKIVRAFFVTDGVIDGSGPGVDFETIELGSIFSNLQRLTISTDYLSAIAFDNLVY